MSIVPKSDRSTIVTLASASAGPFDLKFRLFDDDGLLVYVNALPRTDFTITSSYTDGYDDDATISFDDALDAGDVIFILGDLRPRRDSDYLNGPDLVAKMNIENGRIWSVLSELHRGVSRSIKFFSSVSPIAMTAGRALVVNETGDGVEMGPDALTIEQAEEFAVRAEEAALSLDEFAPSLVARVDLIALLSDTDAAANRIVLEGLAADGADIDLFGLNILVDAIPAGRFSSGSFKVEASGISYPQRGLFAVSTAALPKGGDPIQSQFQGNGHFDERGQSLEINVASGYLENDLSLVQYRSTDSGATWYRKLEADPDDIIRHSYYPTASWKFGGRTNFIGQGRAPGGDKVQWFSKIQPYIEAQANVTVSTVAGSPLVRIGFENHGVSSSGWALDPVTMEVVKFAIPDGANAGVGGIDIANILGNRVMTYQGSKDICNITAATNATTTETTTRIVTLQMPTSGYEPMLFAGGTLSLEDALIANIAGLTSVTIIQGITHDDQLPIAAVSGNIKCLVELPTGVSLPQTLTKRLQFLRTSGDLGGRLTEPSIASNPYNTDFVFGFLRTQDSAIELPNFWWSDDRGVTLGGQSPIVMPAGYPQTFLNRSPIPCALGEDGYIYGMATDRLTTGTGVQGMAGVYLLVAKLEDAIAQGGAAFQIHKIAETLITARAGTEASGLSSEASQVGRPTVIREDGLLHFFYESERPLDSDFYTSSQYAEVDAVRVTIDTERTTLLGGAGSGGLPTSMASQFADASEASAQEAQAAVDAATGAVYGQIAPILPPLGASTVSDADYSSFPVLARSGDTIISLFHHGVNHTQGDTSAVAASQIATTAFVIDGNNASGGAVSLIGGSVATLTAATNESGITFTLSGTYNGSSVSEVVAGPNAETKTLTQKFDTITGVTVSGTTGATSIGLLRVASNVEAAISTDMGSTWQTPVAIFDGMTTGEKRYYYPMIGTLKDGTIYAACTEIDIDAGTNRAVYRIWSAASGWGDLQQMSFTGDYPSQMAFFNKFDVTPTGRLVCGVHLSDITYSLVSDDNGATWAGTVARAADAELISEPTIRVVSEKVWLMHIRIDARTATFFQMKTVDAGATWTAMGEVGPFPNSSGYDSHDVLFPTVNGTRYILMVVMSRNNAVSGDNPECIIAKWGKLSDVLSDATAFFSGEEVLASGLIERSGYPSLVYDRATNEAVMVYHNETASRASQVEAVGVNLSKIILGDGEWKTFTPVMTGDTGTDPVLNISNGRVLRRGSEAVIQADIRVFGAMTITSGIDLDVSAAGVGVFDSPLAVIAAPVSVEKTKSDVQNLLDVHVRAVGGGAVFELWHLRDNGTRSQLTGSEVNADFRVSFTATVQVK